MFEHAYVRNLQAIQKRSPATLNAAHWDSSHTSTSQAQLSKSSQVKYGLFTEDLGTTTNLVKDPSRPVEAQLPFMPTPAAHRERVGDTTTVTHSFKEKAGIPDCTLRIVHPYLGFEGPFQEPLWVTWDH